MIRSLSLAVLTRDALPDGRATAPLAYRSADLKRVNNSTTALFSRKQSG